MTKARSFVTSLKPTFLSLACSILVAGFAVDASAQFDQQKPQQPTVTKRTSHISDDSK
jgi:hypothetical protein